MYSLEKLIQIQSDDLEIFTKNNTYTLFGNHSL